MIDQGDNVQNDQPNNRFLLRPLGSDKVYSFGCKNVEGSENRFYCCDDVSALHGSRIDRNQSRELVEIFKTRN